MPPCGVCVSVCLSVTFVDSVKTSNRIFKIFSQSGSHTILIFPYQTSWQYSDGNTPKGGGLNAGGVGKSRNSRPVSGFIACCQRCDRQVLLTGAAGPWQVVTAIAGSKRRSLLMAGDDDEMFMTRSFNVTPKTSEQHLIDCTQ